MTPGPRNGFTLLEMLVALVILGFLMAGLTNGVQLGVGAWDRQARAAASSSELDAVDRALRRLVAGVYPGDRTHPSGLNGTATELRMDTVLPLAVSGAEGETSLSLERGALVLRWRPRPPGERAGPGPPPERTELLRGLSGLRFGYLGPQGWQDGWDGGDPPALVRIALLFPPDDPAGRHWPPIIAAPGRTREGR